MILKKPYGFLIKHFKLVHIVITLLLIFVTYKCFSIYSFLNDYINNKYTVSATGGFGSTYVPFILFIVVLFIIVIYLLIASLFKNKKKPSKYYEFSSLYFIILFILLFVVRTILVGMEDTLIEAKLARIYRDISLMTLLPIFPVILISFVRALGFNVKKFDFEKELKEIKLEEEDSEEVEITFNYEGYKIIRILRRFIREFKYYFKENKYIVITICSIVILIFGYLIVSNISKDYDNYYKEDNLFYYNGLNIKVIDSIVTNLDYKGDIIDNSYYIVLQTYIENTSNIKVDFKYDNFKLILNDNYLYPENNIGNYFVDYGVPLYGSSISKSSNGIYTLIYKIDKKDIKSSYKLSLYKGTVSTKEGPLDTFNYIKINPVLVDSRSIVGNYEVGDKVDLSDSNMLNTSIKVNSVDINTKYEYDYQVCLSTEDCRQFKDYISSSNSNKTLLIMKTDYKLDKSSPYKNTSSSFSTFLSNFGRIRYLNSNNEYEYSELVNVTPTKLKNTFVFEVNNNFTSSEEVYLSITVRNKEYLVCLK